MVILRLGTELGLSFSLFALFCDRLFWFLDADSGKELAIASGFGILRRVKWPVINPLGLVEFSSCQRICPIACIELRRNCQISLLLLPAKPTSVQARSNRISFLIWAFIWILLSSAEFCWTFLFRCLVLRNSCHASTFSSLACIFSANPCWGRLAGASTPSAWRISLSGPRLPWREICSPILPDQVARAEFTLLLT